MQKKEKKIREILWNYSWILVILVPSLIVAIFFRNFDYKMPALLLHYHHHAFILFRRDSLMKNLATFETFKRFWMYIYLGRYIYVLCTYVLKKPMPNYFKRPRKLQTFTYLTIQWLHQSHDRWVDPWPCGKNVKKINKNHNRLTAVFTLVNNMVKKRKNFFLFCF